MSTNPHNEFEIAPGVKNTDWQALKLSPQSDVGAWQEATTMFRKRMERFTKPARALMKHHDKEIRLYSGFAIIVLDCLLIETLQSFREGRPNPEKMERNSKKKKQTSTVDMFINFLKRPRFQEYFDDEKTKIFYNHFRNGLLHQGEVKSSGRIKKGSKSLPMIEISQDKKSLIVYRDIFHEALEAEIEDYIQELIEGKDAQLRENFIKKMNEICRVPEN